MCKPYCPFRTAGEWWGLVKVAHGRVDLEESEPEITRWQPHAQAPWDRSDKETRNTNHQPKPRPGCIGAWFACIYFLLFSASRCHTIPRGKAYYLLYWLIQQPVITTGTCQFLVDLLTTNCTCIHLSVYVNIMKLWVVIAVPSILDMRTVGLCEKDKAVTFDSYTPVEMPFMT